MKIRFGRGPHAILILAYIRDGVYEWVGADDVVIYTYNGRIIRTIGLTHNFELKKYRDVIHPATDSASELVNLYNPDLYSGPDGAVGYVYKNTLYVGGATPINTNNNPTTFYNPIVYLSNDLSNPVSNVISSIKLADSNPWPFTPGASPDSMSNAQNWVNNKVYMEINWNPNFNWLPFDFKVLFTLQASGLALNSSSVEDIAFEAAFTVNFNY